MENQTDLRGHAGAVNALAFSPDGRLLASAGDDGTVRLWDVARREEVRLPQALASSEPSLGHGRNHRALALAFDPDGRTLATGAEQGTIKFWNPATGMLLDTFEVPDAGRARITSLAYSKDGSKLAAGVAYRTIRTARCRAIIWHAATGETLSMIEGGWCANPAVAFLTNDGVGLAFSGAGGERRGVTLHNAVTGERREELLTPLGNGATALAVSADGRYLAAVELAWTTEPVKLPFYRIVMWDIETQRAVAASDPQAEPVSSLALSEDGKLLAVGDSSWTNLTAKLLPRTTFSTEEGPVLAVALSPHATHFAAGYRRGVIYLWEVPEWQFPNEPPPQLPLSPLQSEPTLRGS